MQFKPLTDKQKLWLLMPIIVPVIIICLPVLLIMAAIGLISVPFEKMHYNYVATEMGKGWQTWYAWHPVLLEGFWYNREDKYAWLENIERRRRTSGWTKRFPGEGF